MKDNQFSTVCHNARFQRRVLTVRIAYFEFIGFDLSKSLYTLSAMTRYWQFRIWSVVWYWPGRFVTIFLYFLVRAENGFPINPCLSGTEIGDQLQLSTKEWIFWFTKGFGWEIYSRSCSVCNTLYIKTFVMNKRLWKCKQLRCVVTGSCGNGFETWIYDNSVTCLGK